MSDLQPFLARRAARHASCDSLLPDRFPWELRCESETGRCDVFGNETFWLNVVNAAFGVATVAAILAVLVATILEVAGRARHPR